MKCRLFRDLLDEYMDNELTDVRREAVDKHAHACPECRELLQERQRLFHRLTDIFEPDWDLSLADSVMTEIRTLPLPQSANPLRRPIFIALATAFFISGVLLFIGLTSLPDTLSPIDLFKLMAGSVEMPPALRASLDELGAFLSACWVIVKTMIHVVVQIAGTLLFRLPLTIPFVVLTSLAGFGLWRLFRRRRGSSFLGMM